MGYVLCCAKFPIDKNELKCILLYSIPSYASQDSWKLSVLIQIVREQASEDYASTDCTSFRFIYDEIVWAHVVSQEGLQRNCPYVGYKPVKQFSFHILSYQTASMENFIIFAEVLQKENIVFMSEYDP